MSGLSTHVLDTARGLPAAGLPVRLEVQERGEWRELSRLLTDGDGRVARLLPPAAPLAAASYRLTFDVGAYHAALGIAGFYPEVVIVFTVRERGEHHHVPLLLAPFGYSTYRGS